MPAAVVAVSGRARALSSRLNLVEWLVVGADEEIGGGVAPIATSKRWKVEPRPGRAVQGAASAARLVPRRNAAGLLGVPHHRSWATPT